MSSQTKPASDRKSKTERKLTVLEVPTADLNEYGAVRIVEGKKTDTYIFRGIEADFGIGYEIEKLTPELDEGEETYHVNLAGRESSCTCMGHTYHGHCRHVAALTTLHERGVLRLKQKHTACNRCNVLVEAPGLCPDCETEDEFHTACNQAAEMEAAGIEPWSSGEADAVYEPA